MFKKLISVIMVTFLILVGNVGVFANTVEDDVDPSFSVTPMTPLLPAEDLGSVWYKKGSITVTIPDSSEVLYDGEHKLSKEGVKFSVSKVASIVNGEYILDDDYKVSGVDFTAIKTSDDLLKAVNSLYKYRVSDVDMVSDSSGVASIKDLEVGVYLVYAEDIAGYEYITPFMVSIPTWSEDMGSMNYDVAVTVKHSPVPKPLTPSKAPQLGVSNLDNGKLNFVILCVLLVICVIILSILVFKLKGVKYRGILISLLVLMVLGCLVFMYRIGNDVVYVVKEENDKLTLIDEVVSDDRGNSDPFRVK